MKKLIYGVVSFLLFSCFAISQINAQTIVVPDANEFVEGDSNNGFPFNAGAPMRYQQVYASSQFAECGQIVQINFRYDEFTGADSVNYPNILIRLSATSVTPATLSNTFAANIGPNVSTVYSGNLSFAAPECDAGPCPFDNTINLQVPFNYTPSDGNLLLDVTVPTSENYQQFDSVENSPFVQRVWNFGDAAAASGEIAGDNGLVTEFVCISAASATVPTLSEWGLIAMSGILGIAGFLAMRRRKAVA